MNRYQITGIIYIQSVREGVVGVTKGERVQGEEGRLKRERERGGGWGVNKRLKSSG